MAFSFTEFPEGHFFLYAQARELSVIRSAVNLSRIEAIKEPVFLFFKRAPRPCTTLPTVLSQPLQLDVFRSIREQWLRQYLWSM